MILKEYALLDFEGRTGQTHFRSAGSGITLDTLRYLTYDDAHSSDHKARGVVLCFCEDADDATEPRE